MQSSYWVDLLDCEIGTVHTPHRTRILQAGRGKRSCYCMARAATSRTGFAISRFSRGTFGSSPSTFVGMATPTPAILRPTSCRSSLSTCATLPGRWACHHTRSKVNRRLGGDAGGGKPSRRSREVGPDHADGPSTGSRQRRVDTAGFCAVTCELARRPAQSVVGQCAGADGAHPERSEIPAGRGDRRAPQDGCCRGSARPHWSTGPTTTRCRRSGAAQWPR
jgi:hypothetical protein